MGIIQAMELMLMIEPLPADFHAGNDCLRGEELVAQVYGHALIPVFVGYFVDTVAVVAGCVVDEDLWWAECGGDFGDCGLEGGDVGDVAAAVDGWMGGVGSEIVDKCGGGFVGEIEEGYAGALQGEVSTAEAPMPCPPPVMRTTLSARLG